MLIETFFKFWSDKMYRIHRICIKLRCFILATIAVLVWASPALADDTVSTPSANNSLGDLMLTPGPDIVLMPGEQTGNR